MRSASLIQKPELALLALQRKEGVQRHRDILQHTDSDSDAVAMNAEDAVVAGDARRKRGKYDARSGMDKNRMRDSDILGALGVGVIVDLMVERKLAKYGLKCVGSEKVSIRSSCLCIVLLTVARCLLHM